MSGQAGSPPLWCRWHGRSIRSTEPRNKTLLTDYLEQQRLARLGRQRVSEAAAASWNNFNREHGSIADEFSSL